MPNSPLLEQVKRLRAAQAAREGAELERLVSTYQAIDRMARREAEALALKLMDKYAGTNGPTANELRKLARYREMMETVQHELEDYQSFMKVELRSQSNLAITDGERAARTLGELAARGVGISAQFRALNPAVIEQLVGFLDPGGPLYKRLGMLGGWTSEQVAQKITEGISLGLNPRTTARMLTKRLQDEATNALGMGLSSALRTMRTTQLYAYREASRASYQANAEIVTGWYWHSELDSLTCPTCVSMHGSFHTLDETLDGHWNCRCSPVPAVVGAPSPVTTSGEEWFNSLSDNEQRDILGKGAYEAWRDGKFNLSDVVTHSPDEIFGQMRTTKTLNELTGGK